MLYEFFCDACGRQADCSTTTTGRYLTMECPACRKAETVDATERTILLDLFTPRQVQATPEAA